MSGPDLAFTLKAIAKALVLPPAGPIVVALLGLAVMRRAPRTGRAMIAVGGTSLALLCFPIVAWLLARPFDAGPLDVADASRAQAIVILGGGTRQKSPEYGGDTLGRLTLERVRYGARVARATGLPLLVAGGSLFGAESTEAGLMREALEQEYGLPVRWSESASRNTRENARLSAPLLMADGVTTIVLVVHAVDMPRARAEFESAGLRTIPAPIGLYSNVPLRIEDFVPSASALVASYYATYELLANLVLFLEGG